MFERLQYQQKNYMQIARQIRNLIRDGTLKIGERLPSERELVQQFGASRASIREALSALEMLGLIECRSGQGNFVKADGSEGAIDGELLKTLLQDHDPYEIFEARLELEPSLGGLAADRANEEEREKLKTHVKELEDLAEKVISSGFDAGIIQAYMEEDRRFHLSIGSCAHNYVLFTVFSGVNLMMKETHWTTLKSKGLTQTKNVLAYQTEHKAILDAILSRNARAARAALRKHILLLKKSLF